MFLERKPQRNKYPKIFICLSEVFFFYFLFRISTCIPDSNCFYPSQSLLQLLLCFPHPPFLLNTVTPFNSYCKIALIQVSMATGDRIIQGMFSQPSLWDFIGTTFLSCTEDTSQKQIPCPLPLTFFPPVSSIMFPEP